MSKKKGQRIETADEAVREMAKCFTSFHRHGTYQAFSDFLTLAACSISNAIDRQFFEEREKLYLDTIKRYSKDEAGRFAELLALLVQAFEPTPGAVVYRDVLGELFMSLELGNEWAGQFFTPYSVALAKAMMVVGDADSLRAEIEARGFVRAMEPAVGGGALVIATADAMKRLGINYQQHLHCTCIDIDLKAVCMAYIQLSLLHVPAVVIHGNALSNERWSTWCTPAHVLGRWAAKLGRDRQDVPAPVHELVPAERVASSIALDAQPLDAGQLTLF
jgi:type I restriction-modification system DNA methylase subunit